MQFNQNNLQDILLYALDNRNDPAVGNVVFVIHARLYLLEIGSMRRFGLPYNRTPQACLLLLSK